MINSGLSLRKKISDVIYYPVTVFIKMFFITELGNGINTKFREIIENFELNNIRWIPASKNGYAIDTTYIYRTQIILEDRRCYQLAASNDAIQFDQICITFYDDIEDTDRWTIPKSGTWEMQDGSAVSNFGQIITINVNEGIYRAIWNDSRIILKFTPNMRRIEIKYQSQTYEANIR